ncbi:MAG: hypothetical protein E7006_01450 [Alphaproteobacteria bacterium]|nr:hypothetical protein [Alphaproteobacteria bacterium]
MQEPKIVYKQITINNANIDEFLQMQQAARYKATSNSIIIYDYTLDDSAGLEYSKSRQARKIIKFVRQDRSRSIEHETQHWRNWCAVGDVAEVTMDNYYQEILLYCLDEISAFTAAAFYSSRHLSCRGACAETISIALHSGISEFVYGAGLSFYLEDLVQYTLDTIKADLRSGYVNIKRLKQLQSRTHRNPNGAFSRRFRRAARHYLTFDGYCILDDKLSGDALQMWHSVIKMLQDIRSIYTQSLSRAIDNLIAARAR